MDLRPEVRQFLLRNFDSADALDIVALLGRSPETFWTALAVSRQLGLREQVAASNLSLLSGRRILVRGEETGAYRFAPAEEATRRLIDELMQRYTQDRQGLVRAIYAGRLQPRSADEERPKHE